MESNQTFNLEGSAYLEIGIKATKADGLVMQRMSEIKKKMTDRIKSQMAGALTGKTPAAESRATTEG